MRTAAIALGVVMVVGCGSKPAPTAASATAHASVANAAPEDTVPATTTRPQLEVRDHGDRVDLPAVPAFDLPAVEPGYHSALELRVRGTKLRGTEVKVRGYVTWIYDCPTALALPGISKRAIQKMIDDDPTVCERPKFYLGDAATTRPEESMWVVDVPRKPNKLEKKRLSKKELAAWPAVPKIKVGDQVTVVGTFALRSPHSESNSDGLIVYASLTHDRPGAAKEVPAPTPPSTVSAATPATAPAPARIERGTLDAAERSYRACQEAIASNRLEDAAAACRAATETWPGHHAAWWTLGMIHAKSGDLSSAADEFQRAATLDPEAAMYQMWLGIALYERARIAARDDLAARTGQPASDGMIDLSGVDLDAALATLLLAAQLEPRLFRAHYYIGRIHRDHDRARQAAEAFTAAIAADPFRGVSFVALAQLYESWGYLQEAIEVAEAGARSVPGARERSDVWTVLGRVYDAHGEPDRALDALENALDAWPDNATARFERGQARFRRKDYAGAKEDLTIYATSGAYRDGFNRVLTNKMLLESAAELAGQER